MIRHTDEWAAGGAVRMREAWLDVRNTTATHNWEHRLTGVLAAGIVVLLVLHGVNRSPWCDLDRERNLPAVFSTMLFLLAGLAALRNAAHSSRQGILAWPWVLLGSAVLFASADEWFSIHEQITVFARALTGVTQLKNVWTFFYVAAIGGGMLLLRRWWRGLWQAHPEAAGCFALGVAAWLVSYIPELSVQLWRIAPASHHKVLIMAEEGLEMYGALLWVYGCLLVSHPHAHSQAGRGGAS